MTSAALGHPTLPAGTLPARQEALNNPARMDRRLLIVAAVIGFHVLGLWALQTGLLRRAVELVVPVTVMADLIEPPQPQVTPDSTPPKPLPAAKPVTPVQRVVRQAPMPQAISDPTPAAQAPTGVVSAPAEPQPAVTEPVAAAPVSTPAPAPTLNTVTDNFRALPPPPFPPMSNRLREQGSVHLSIRIEADGTASSVIVTRSSGFQRLDEAAVTAALKWRYVLRSGGTPRPDTYQHVVRFELN